MDYHDVVDELESAERELGLAACDVDESEGAWPEAALRSWAAAGTPSGRPSRAIPGPRSPR